MTVALRPARPGEAAALTALILRSKAYWGYDDAFMAACEEELTVTEERLTGGMFIVAVDRSETPLGAAEISFEGAIAWLEKLFVDPEAMGRGVGRALFEWAVETADEGGATALIIAADPDAEAFYRTLGAERDGDIASDSIPGRRLPRLVVELSAHQPP